MIEQAGGIVASVTEGMKGNPSCLAAILLAGVFAFMTYQSMQNERLRNHEREMQNRELMISMLRSCPLPDDQSKSAR